MAYQDEWRAGSQSCVAWFNSKLGQLPDGPVKFARMVSLAVLLGGLGLVVLLMAYALWDPLFGVTDEHLDTMRLPTRQNWPMWPVRTVGLVVSSGLAVFTLLLMSFVGGAECDRVERCRLAAGGYLCILASLVWASVAGVLWWLGGGSSTELNMKRAHPENETADKPTLQEMADIEEDTDGSGSDEDNAVASP